MLLVVINVLSIEPSVFNLIILFADEPLYVSKVPTTSILPSDWIFIPLTPPSNPVPILNVLSIEPSVFNLTINLRARLLYDVNEPPTTNLPSDCCWIENGTLLNPVPILNVLSIVPLVFNLMILFLVVPLYEVKLPPIIILPSDCTTPA